MFYRLLFVSHHEPPPPSSTGDPRPPSVSFPGSSLQAGGGRVPLHVSPEMSHRLKRTNTRTQPRVAALLLHGLVCQGGPTHKISERKEAV